MKFREFMAMAEGMWYSDSSQGGDAPKGPYAKTPSQGPAPPGFNPTPGKPRGGEGGGGGGGAAAMFMKKMKKKMKKR